MAFIIGPIVLGFGLLLAGCGGSSSSDRDANPNPNPDPSGSAYVPPSPTGSALLSPPPARTSPIATLLAAPPEPFAAGAAPSGTDLTRYPGANDEERARNWAMNRAVERYFTEMRRVYPGIAPRDAVNSVLSLIQANTTAAPLRVTYTVGNGTPMTINVDHPEIVFLSRLVRDDVSGLRALMHRETMPDPSDQQYTDLKTAANDLLRAARSEGGAAGDASAHPSPADTAPRPVGSAAPRPTGGGNHVGNGSGPAPRRSVSF